VVFGLLFGVGMLTGGSVAIFAGGPGLVDPVGVIVVSSFVALTLVARIYPAFHRHARFAQPTAE
jgi:hypothetical protein